MRKSLILICGCVAIIIPASAQISADDATRMCRDQVRQDASSRFGSSEIVFRSTNINKHEDVRNRVSGKFVVPDQGPQIHTFVCSVNLDNGNLRWVQIDSQNAVNSSGSANRAALTDSDVMNLCRDVVRGKIFDHGYIQTNFNSIDVENTPGRTDLITGEATGFTGGHEDVFRFSCTVDQTTGTVRSTELNDH